MKRVLIITFTSIFLFSTVPLFADGNLNLDFKIDGSLSIISGIFITPSVRAIYDMGVFGAGAELKYTHNLTYNDSYLLGFGIAKLGPIYGGLGFAAKLTNAHDPTGEYYFATSETGIELALTCGALFKPIPLGPGKLGFNLGFDLFPSDTPVESSEVSDPADLIGSIAYAIIEGFAWGIIYGINMVKINLGVNYTVVF